MKKRLLIIGGHGSGEIAMSVFEDVNSLTEEWVIEGFLSDVVPPGEYLGKHKVIGGTNEIKHFVEEGYYIHYTLQFNAKKKLERVNMFKELQIPLEANASAIHPRASIDTSTKMGFGILALPFAVSSTDSEIGNFIHIYTSAYIGQNAKIKDYCTISAHSNIRARVKLDEGVSVGLNSTLLEDVEIGKYSIIEIGSTVNESFKEFSEIAGNPAKLIKEIKH